MKVTLIGSLPPQKGISPYTTHLIRSLAACPGVELEVIGFRSLYPPMLYPGGEIDDPTTRGDLPEEVSTRRLLAWYDPLSWVRVGLTAQGDIIHAQWWSYVLAPAYAVLLRAA